LKLAPVLVGEVPRVMEMVFPGSVGRWEMHRTTFRQEGRPHTLVVLSDLSRALREEERQVWQRLIRVLGHELNNSLTPIKSIAGSLQNVL
jgi:nitrogen fixation/metabolism regulation signal transduction histidine kinase